MFVGGVAIIVEIDGSYTSRGYKTRAPINTAPRYVALTLRCRRPPRKYAQEMSKRNRYVAEIIEKCLKRKSSKARPTLEECRGGLPSPATSAGSSPGHRRVARCAKRAAVLKILYVPPPRRIRRACVIRRYSAPRSYSIWYCLLQAAMLDDDRRRQGISVSGRRKSNRREKHRPARRELARAIVKACALRILQDA